MGKCKDCEWWQDYTDRVYAQISHARGDMARNTIELRCCKFVPHPSRWDFRYSYTDCDYVCGEFKPKEKKE